MPFGLLSLWLELKLPKLAEHSLVLFKLVQRFWCLTLKLHWLHQKGEAATIKMRNLFGKPGM